MQTPDLYTERLCLRQIQKADLPQLTPISFYDGKPARNEDEAWQMLMHIERDVRAGDSLHWAVALRSTNELIGTCGFYRGFANHTGEIGYVLREEFRGQGYMQEAVQAVIFFGFRQLHLQKITAFTEDSNQASIRLLQRVGFQKQQDRHDELLTFYLLPPVAIS